MKKVIIKHNPYKLETEITVDGKPLKQNSKVRDIIGNESRLQEWVEEVPEPLIAECNDTDLEITFHGILLDYEDLYNVFIKACEKEYELGKLKMKIEHKQPTKEAADIEDHINKVFEKIQQGPFEELRDEVNAFNHAKVNNFEVYVIAAMNAGKSTLINSMLATKLMPSGQGVSTAIITKIQDNDDRITFKARAYDKDKKLLQKYKKLKYKNMVSLNNNKDIFEVEVSGNIPFIMSDDVSLVLIDTPGLPNSRDQNYEKIQSEFLDKSSQALIIYIITSELSIHDDNDILKSVAESMKARGKQSKERFIFVVNDLDGHKKQNEDINQTLENIRSYLHKRFCITKPNLFPVSALNALNIRLMARGVEVGKNARDELMAKVGELNCNDLLHFEKYAPLSSSIRNEINNELKYIRSKGDGENLDEALIHTGIVSIEAAIRQYIDKYVKTARIKNIIDTFIYNLKEPKDYEGKGTKQLLFQKLKEEHDKNVENLNKIQENLKNLENWEQQKFRLEFKAALEKAEKDSKKEIGEIIQEFRNLIAKKLRDLSYKKLSINEAKKETDELMNFARKLGEDFRVKLEKLIHANDIEDFSVFTTDPLKLMQENIRFEDSIIRLIRNKGDKKEPHIYGSEIARIFSQAIQQKLYENADIVYKYIEEESDEIAKRFEDELNRLDEVVKTKLELSTEKENAENRVKELERNLTWLNEIQAEIESIWEIY